MTPAGPAPTRPAVTPAADLPPLWPEGWWVEPCDTEEQHP